MVLFSVNENWISIIVRIKTHCNQPIFYRYSNGISSGEEPTDPRGKQAHENWKCFLPEKIWSALQEYRISDSNSFELLKLVRVML